MEMHNVDISISIDEEHNSEQEIVPYLKHFQENFKL